MSPILSYVADLVVSQCKLRRHIEVPRTGVRHESRRHCPSNPGGCSLILLFSSDTHPHYSLSLAGRGLGRGSDVSCDTSPSHLTPPPRYPPPGGTRPCHSASTSSPPSSSPGPSSPSSR